jgi:hypothetical protein
MSRNKDKTSDLVNVGAEVVLLKLLEHNVKRVAQARE